MTYPNWPIDHLIGRAEWESYIDVHDRFVEQLDYGESDQVIG